MWKYLIRVIILACLFGLVPTVISAQEGEGDAKTKGGNETQREEKLYTEEEHKEELRETEQEERIVALDKAINNQYWTFSIIVAALAIVSASVIVILNLSYRRKENQAVTKLQKRYESRLAKLYRDITERANTITRDVEGHRERLKELANIVAKDTEAAKELVSNAKRIIEEAMKSAPSGDEAYKVKKGILTSEEHIKLRTNFPTLIYNADVLYDSVIRGDSYDIGTLNNLARSLFYNKRYDKAIGILDIIINDYPDTADYYYYKGLVLLASEKYREAVDELNRAIVLDGEYTAAYNDRSVALFELGEYQESLEMANVVIEREPRRPEGHNNKARALMKLGDLDGAYTTVEKGIRIAPELPEGYHNKGLILAELKKYRSAIQAFDEAIKLKPDYFEAYYNKGLMLHKLKKYGEAIGVYNEAIEINPKLLVAYLNKSASLVKLKRYTEAIQACEAALKIEPNLAVAHFNMACAYSMSSEKRKMLFGLERAIELEEEKREEAKTDPDFDRYRDDEDFKRLVEGEESG